ncbi:MAG: hypothetical protein JJT76_10860 [Clostridiaceae bacterium]|nr:hypothetical protein [Clostridiaceae bacterium]
MACKANMKYKLILIVLLPFIIGYFIEGLMGLGMTRNNQLYLSIASMVLSFWIYGGIVFWFYVGRVFGSLNMNTIKSFILGNSAWGISFSLYIWQFRLLDETSRNFFLGGIAQHYVLGFVGWGSRILTLFTNHIQGIMALQIAYFLMLIVFSLGFYSALKSKSSKSY